MSRVTRPAVSLLALLLLSAAGAARPQTPPAQAGQAAQEPSDQQPVFRTGINFVRVDVIVTDNKGNPIVDLDENDFEVYEDGAPQSVESFKLVQIGPNPGPEAEPARPIRTQYDQEREAARDDVRLFVIMFDDYHVRRGSAMAVKAPLIRFLTQLSPLDMVAIMYPLTPTDLISFTRDRAATASAIDAFEGRKYIYDPRNQFEEQYAYYPAATVERIRNDVSLSALRGLVTWLGTVREGRKSVILVSEGYTNNLPPTLNDPIAAMPGVNNPLRGAQGVEMSPQGESQRFFTQAEMMTEIRRVFDAANRSNTAIYTLDPRGLAVFEYDINEGVGIQSDRKMLGETLDTLHVLADETDGRAIVNSNDLDRGLRQAVSDASVYYLLGYNSTAAPTDGKFHEIKVRVKRPGVQVRARKGYWAYTAEDAERATAPPDPGPPPDVEEALASLAVPSRGRLARTWIGTARGEDGKTKVTFVWEPLPRRAGDRENLGLPVKAQVTASGADQTLYFRGTVEPGADAAVAVRPPAAVSFEAAPGPLQLRAMFEAADGGIVDTERRIFDVPDFTTTDVALSTPQVFRTFTPREMRELRGNPDAVPVSGREFSRRERLLLRFEAYGPGGTAPEVTVRLLNRDAQPMTDLPVEPPAEAGAPYQVEIPLASLPPGEYMIEVAATAAEEPPVRQLVGVKVSS